MAGAEVPGGEGKGWVGGGWGGWGGAVSNATLSPLE